MYDNRVGIIDSQSPRLFVEAIAADWRTLGFDIIEDEAFFQLVLARLVPPTSDLTGKKFLNIAIFEFQ